MKCLSCNAYYRRSEWNTADYCEQCVDAMEDQKYNSYDVTDDVEIEALVNPTGRTQPHFYD